MQYQRFAVLFQTSSCRYACNPLVIATPPSLQPNKLHHLDPEAERLIGERRLVGIERWPLPNHIGLTSAYELRALDELPAEEEDWRKDQHGIVAEKGADIEGRSVRAVTVAADYVKISFVLEVVGEKVMVDLPISDIHTNPM